VREVNNDLPDESTPAAHGAIRPRGSFLACSRTGETLRIFVYDVVDAEPGTSEGFRLTAESGEPIRYCGRGRYLAVDGTPYESNDPLAL
jgi:hypothetical protein